MMDFVLNCAIVCLQLLLKRAHSLREQSALQKSSLLTQNPLFSMQNSSFLIQIHHVYSPVPSRRIPPRPYAPAPATPRVLACTCNQRGIYQSPACIYTKQTASNTYGPPGLTLWCTSSSILAMVAHLSGNGGTDSA